MARKDSDNQKRSMSLLFRGKAIFKPLNTGRIDARVACVREWVANIFFYTKNGTTVMIDAGYNYERLREKMGWLDVDPASIRHIFITHGNNEIMLTERGEKLANETLKRNLTIQRFLIGLGVDRCVAEADACKMEHIISAQSLQAMVAVNFRL